MPLSFPRIMQPRVGLTEGAKMYYFLSQLDEAHSIYTQLLLRSAIGTKLGSDIFLQKMKTTRWRIGLKGQKMQTPGLSLENTQTLQIIQWSMNCSLSQSVSYRFYILQQSPHNSNINCLHQQKIIKLVAYSSLRGENVENWIGITFSLYHNMSSTTTLAVISSKKTVRHFLESNQRSAANESNISSAIWLQVLNTWCSKAFFLPGMQ